MLRCFLFALLLGFGLHYSYAQDEWNSLEEFQRSSERYEKEEKERLERLMQSRRDLRDKARQVSYIRRTFPSLSYQRVLNEKNQITPFTHLDFLFRLDCYNQKIDWRVARGEPALWSLMNAVYPYMKDYSSLIDEHDSFAINLYANLGKVLEEVDFTSKSDLLSSVPIEIFERIEAEVFETGVKLDYDVRDLMRRSPKSKAFMGYFDFPLQSYKADLWDKFQHLYTGDYPYVAERTHALSDRHKSLVYDIIVSHLKRTSEGFIDWDAYTFRYHTPPIIMRTIIDCGEGEYLNRANGAYSVRGGGKSCLLFPDEKRHYPRGMKTTAINKQNERYYHILYNHHLYRNLSDTEFAVQLVARLSQVYIAHELAVEGRIVPSVKAHLDKVSWYDGNFGELLAYYAEVKGLSFETLTATYIKEQLEVLEQVLPKYHQSAVEPLLRETLQ